MTPSRSTGTRVNTAPVTSRYEPIETTPARAIAGPRSRRGLRISSPIVEASSMPTSALHITAKPAAVSQVTFVMPGACALTPRLNAMPAAAMTRAPRKYEDGHLVPHRERREREQREQPPRPPIPGDWRDVIDVDNGDDLQQHEIPATQRARKRRKGHDASRREATVETSEYGDSLCF